MIDGSELRQARKRKALSQRDLSKTSGVAQATIAQLERGEREARPTTLRKLSWALGVEPAALLADPEKASREGRPSNPSINTQRSQAAPEAQEKPWTRMRTSRTGVELFDKSGRVHRFGSLEEAYVAGFDVITDLADDHPNVPDRYTLVLSKLASDDPEQIEEAADLALYIANNIAQGLEERSRTQTAAFVKNYEAIPDAYYENPTSAMRMAKLWKRFATRQQEANQKGAKAIQDLISLHAKIHTPALEHGTERAARKENP